MLHIIKLNKRHCLGLYMEFEYRHHVTPSQQMIKESNTKLEETMHNFVWCKVKHVPPACHVGNETLHPGKDGVRFISNIKKAWKLSCCQKRWKAQRKITREISAKAT
jgi:hypothetical protein